MHATLMVINPGSSDRELTRNFREVRSTHNLTVYIYVDVLTKFRPISVLLV